MEILQKFCDVAREFHKTADFLIVYQEEAHALGKWHLEFNPHQIRSHRTMEDRIEAAEVLMSLTDIPLPVVVDQMNNAASIAYGAMPERLYIIQNDVVKYQGKPGAPGYKLSDVSEWLLKNVKHN